MSVSILLRCINPNKSDYLDLVWKLIEILEDDKNKYQIFVDIQVEINDVNGEQINLLRSKYSKNNQIFCDISIQCSQPNEWRHCALRNVGVIVPKAEDNIEANWLGPSQMMDEIWTTDKEFELNIKNASFTNPANGQIYSISRLVRYIEFEFGNETEGGKSKEKIKRIILNEKNAKIVSIITSVYKGGKYIKAFMEDIVRQRNFENNCELILIDGNSPENEYEVIKPFMDKYPQNIIYKRLNKDPGLYSCWNMAIKMAGGEFITNANLDDRKHPDFIDILSETLFRDDEVDVVFADNLMTFQPNETWENNSATSTYITENFSLEALLRGNPPHCMPMWRKKIHDKIGYFDEKYRSASDWEFWLRCESDQVKFKKINKALGLYYFNPEGVSTNPDNSWKKQEEDEIGEKYRNKKEGIE